MDPWLLGIAFFLLQSRLLAFLITVPIFGAPAVPAQFKLVLGAFLAAVLVASAPVEATARLRELGISATALDYRLLVLLVQELAIGLLLALVVTFILAAFQLAGFLQGYQMGFTIANVVDPLTQEQASIVGQALFFMGMLVFLAMDAHHLLLRGLVESVRLVPPGTFAYGGPAVALLLDLAQGTMLAALQIALPVVGTVLLVDLGLGVMARAVPQMNVFMVGLPLKASVGLFILVLSFGATGAVMELYMTQALDRWWWRLLPLLSGA